MTALRESPDITTDSASGKLDWTDHDAVCFGFVNGRFVGAAGHNLPDSLHLLPPVASVTHIKLSLLSFQHRPGFDDAIETWTDLSEGGIDWTNPDDGLPQREEELVEQLEQFFGDPLKLGRGAFDQPGRCWLKPEKYGICAYVSCWDDDLSAAQAREVAAKSASLLGIAHPDMILVEDDWRGEWFQLDAPREDDNRAERDKELWRKLMTIQHTVSPELKGQLLKLARQLG